MGWDYVSELWPPTDVLFIPQVIYGHEESWWNDIDMGLILVRPPELSGNSTSSHVVATREELAK
jgi:hypothetical protein